MTEYSASLGYQLGAELMAPGILVSDERRFMAWTARCKKRDVHKMGIFDRNIYNISIN